MANHIQSFSVALGAHRAGERFRLEIDDSRMGIWDASGEMVKVLAEASSWAHLSNPDMRRLHFFVPRDCSEFQVHVQGVHPGGYGAAILDPDGELVELYRDINPGGALIASGDLATEHEGKGGSAQGTVTVQPDPGKRGQHWSAVFWAFDNLRVRLEGIPPFLTRSREEWFLPEH